MKRIPILIILLFALIPIQAFGASSCSETLTAVGGDVYALTLSWTAHTDGSFTSYTTTNEIHGYLLEVVSDPDTTATGAYPTGDYDITLKTSRGFDVMGTACANRDSSATERARPLSSNSEEYEAVVDGSMTLDIANNSVSGAKGAVVIYYRKRD